MYVLIYIYIYNYIYITGDDDGDDDDDGILRWFDIVIHKYIYMYMYMYFLEWVFYDFFTSRLALQREQIKGHWFKLLANWLGTLFDPSQYASNISLIIFDLYVVSNCICITCICKCTYGI